MAVAVLQVAVALTVILLEAVLLVAILLEAVLLVAILLEAVLLVGVVVAAVAGAAEALIGVRGHGAALAVLLVAGQAVLRGMGGTATVALGARCIGVHPVLSGDLMVQAVLLVAITLVVAIVLLVLIELLVTAVLLVPLVAVRAVRIQTIRLGATILQRGALLIHGGALAIDLVALTLRRQLLLLGLLGLALGVQASPIGLDLLLPHGQVALGDLVLLLLGLIADLGRPTAVLLLLLGLLLRRGDARGDQCDHEQDHDHHDDDQDPRVAGKVHGNLLGVERPHRRCGVIQITGMIPSSVGPWWGIRRDIAARCAPSAAPIPPVRYEAVMSSAPTSEAVEDTADTTDLEASIPQPALVDESRRVLVHLLQGPFLDGRRDGGRYAQLLRDRTAIEARLADLFLELIIDDDAQVAFVRQSEEDPDAPKLLRRLTGMNRLDSVLLLVLRQMLLTQSSRGQRTVVSEAEIQQALAAYRRTTSTDEAGFAKEVRASITKIQRAGLLDEQGDDYEVSPVLRLMIGPDTAREFIALYRQAGVDGLEDPRDAEDPEGADSEDGAALTD